MALRYEVSGRALVTPVYSVYVTGGNKLDITFLLYPERASQIKFNSNRV